MQLGDVRAAAALGIDDDGDIAHRRHGTAHRSHRCNSVGFAVACQVHLVQVPREGCSGEMCTHLFMIPQRLFPLLLAHTAPQRHLGAFVCCANEVVAVAALCHGVLINAAGAYNMHTSKCLPMQQ